MGRAGTIWRITSTSTSSVSCTPKSCSAFCAHTLNALSEFTWSVTPASVCGTAECALPRGLREVSLVYHRKRVGLHPAPVGMGADIGSVYVVGDLNFILFSLDTFKPPNQMSAPPVLSTCSLRTNSECGKERCTLIGPC